VIAGVDAASSWRTSAFDESLELSTKILEYSALGLPVLMNKTPLQERVFGSDYAGFVTTEDEFVETFIALVSDPELYESAVERVREVARDYSPEAIRAQLLPLLMSDAGSRES
jgi:glycosyltransferase involved in cell wall biosynthesis